MTSSVETEDMSTRKHDPGTIPYTYQYLHSHQGSTGERAVTISGHVEYRKLWEAIDGMVIAKMTQLRNHGEWSMTVWGKVEFREGIM